MKRFKEFINEEEEGYLRTAIKYNDKIYNGHQGEAHFQLADRHPELKPHRYKSQIEHGFTDHKGRYYKGSVEGREKAYNYANDFDLFRKEVTKRPPLHAGMLKTKEFK